MSPANTAAAASESPAASTPKATRSRRFWLRSLLIYPLLLAAAPALLMAADNAHDIDFRSTMIACLGCVGLAGVVFGLLLAVRRDGHRAAAMTFWLLVLFFTFGLVFDALWPVLGLSQIRQLLWPLYGVYAVLAACGVIWLWRTRLNVESFTRFAGVAAIVLFAVAARNFVHEYKHYLKDMRRIAEWERREDAEEREKQARRERAQRKSQGSRQDQESQPTQNSGVQLAAYEAEVSPKQPTRLATPPVDPKDLPDVYYIILDGYAREDVLRDVYKFDNSSFIAALRERGFYVADDSHANYPMTMLSLPSSLNMRYVQAECERYGWKYESRAPMAALTRKNAVGRKFQQHGYKVVHFATNWPQTAEMDIADVTYSPEPEFLQREFLGVFLRTTALRPLAASVADTHLYMFDKLKVVPDDPQPTFSFAHFILPHNPYVFDAEGNRRTDIPPELQFHREDGEGNAWHDREGYLGQLQFTNRRILNTIDALIAKSAKPPVIILQSDHGSASLKTNETTARQQPELIKERMAILNAYYVPEDWKPSLYQDITPVNTFRVVFNHLFGEANELLPDKLYFSWYAWPYNTQEVTEQVRGAPAEDPAELGPAVQESARIEH